LQGPRLRRLKDDEAGRGRYFDLRQADQFQAVLKKNPTIFGTVIENSIFASSWKRYYTEN
jgi:hypothetical protein